MNELELAQSVMVDINLVELNSGQIEGLPRNPRFIRDSRYEALVKSIKDFPKMLSYREIIIFPFGKKYIVIGGNMRLRALRELGIKKIPCKVLPIDTSVETLKELVIKDNVSFGNDNFDLLGNEWDVIDLENWGVENLPNFDENDNIEKINRGDENSEWVDMPEFEQADKEIKLTIYFTSENQRAMYVKEKEIEITNNHNGQWTSRL